MKTERKMLIATILVALILLNCFLPILRVAANTDVKVTFESNLYSALKDELSRQQINVGYIDDQRTMVIGEEEIAKVTTLSLNNSNLTDLTGLETFENLTVLDLSSNELTKDSNLEILDNLELLATLDLSSNAIEDVSMIENLDNISNVSLHNQKFNIVEIIELDTSTTSDEITQKTFALPQILSKAGYLKTEWLNEETKTGGPYINWSRFDHKNIKVEVAEKTGNGYTPYKSMVTLRIKVSDSTSTLYNSDINMFFIVVDSNERGIHIPDKNMYDAIKGQLKKDQRVNSDLDSYYNTTPTNLKRNLYERLFDEPQVLVISIDDIINKIPSFKLSNKKIKKLDGIEKFVGLEKELDLSGNYITSIDKLIELQENQIAEEALLRERVSAQLALVADTITKISNINATIKVEEEKIEALEKTSQELRTKITNLESELDELNTSKNDLETAKSTLEREISALQSNITNLEREINTLNTSLTTLNKDIVDLKATKVTQEKELETLKEELEVLKASLEEKEAGAAKAVADKEAEIAKKEEEINLKNQEINQKQADITNKQAEIDSKNQEIRNKKQEVDSKKTTIAIYDTQISEIVIAISEKREELIVLEKELETNSATLSRIMLKITKTEWTLKWKNDVIDNIKDYKEPGAVTSYFSELEISNIEQGVEDTLKRVFDMYSQKISVSESDVEFFINVKDKTQDDINTKFDELNTKIDDAKGYINNLNLKEDVLASVGAEYEAKFNEDLKGILETWGSNVKADLLNESEESGESLNEFKTEILDLRSVLVEKTTNLATVLKPLEDEKKRLEDAIDLLKDELDDETTGLKKQIEDLEDELNNETTGLKKQLNDLKDELNNETTGLKKQLNDLKDELDELKGDLDELKGALENVKTTTEYKNILDQITAKETDINNKVTEINTAEKNIAAKEKEIIQTESTIKTKTQELEAEQNSLTEKQRTLAEKQQELAEKEIEIAAKIVEITEIVSELNKNQMTIAESELVIQELIKSRTALEEILSSQMKRLYKIYNRVDKLASFATSELKTITQEDLNNLTFEEAKAMFEAQISKIGNIEELLREIERNHIVAMFTIPLTVEVEIDKTIQDEVTGKTETVKVTETKPIENPIHTYFSELPREEWTLSTYRAYLNDFRTIDTHFSMLAYCYLERFNNGIRDCVAEEYVDKEIEQLEFDGLSIAHLENAKQTYSNILATYTYTCAGSVDGGTALFPYAARMVEGSGDIEVYVCLPRLKALNVNENLIENIDNVSELTELRILKAHDNEIVDISTISWNEMTKLRILDLGFNGIDDIEPLEVLPNIEEIYLRKNLISGKFEFNIENLSKIKVLDVSENQIDDLENLIKYLTYEARANDFNEIGKFLREGNVLDIRFNNQILTMTIDRKIGVNEIEKIQLPKIFRQIEEIDYSNTSFGIDSLRGNVSSDGKTATLDTTQEGRKSAVVSIISTGATPSLGAGTTCSISYTVGVLEPVNVTVTAESNEMKIGKSMYLTSEVTGDNVSYTGVRWTIEGATSEDTTISAGGLLTIGLDEEADKIIVRATSIYDETKSGEFEITVIKKQVTEVKIIPETATVLIGRNQDFVAEVIGENLEGSDKTVTWEVKNETSPNTIISETGTLTVGLDEEAEKVIVKATSIFDEEKSCEVEITILKKQVTEVKITPETATVLIGRNQDFVAEVIGENLEETDKTVTWEVKDATSADTRISETGTLTVGLDEEAEKVIVKATSTCDETKSCEVEITIIQKQVTEVKITPETATVLNGATQEFVAEVIGENLEENDKTVTWEVKDATSADTRISETGTLTVGLDEEAEKVIIKATSTYDETKSCEVEITLIKKQVTGVTITPENARIFKGDSIVFEAEVLGVNLEDADKGIKWEMSRPSGSPDPDSETIGVPEGNKLTLTIGANERNTRFTIKAVSKYDQTKYGEAVVTIGERTVSGITVTPQATSVEKGKTQAFTADVNGENLRTEDKGVTYSVTGNTSRDTVISSEGVLTVGSDERATTLKVIVTSNLDNTKVTEVVVTVVTPEPSIRLGYTVEDEYIVGVATKTPVDAFKEILTDEYTVVVKQNNREVTTGYMKTGMYVEVHDEDGNIVEDNEGNLLVYEVVVKGDVNSDGVADAIDSSLIKAIRNEVSTVSDAQMRAADLDDDGKVDLLDSKLLLYHRAEVNNYCLDYTE